MAPVTHKRGRKVAASHEREEVPMEIDKEKEVGNDVDVPLMTPVTHVFRPEGKLLIFLMYLFYCFIPLLTSCHDFCVF